MGKGPVYGEFSFPKGDMVHVRAYSRGGKVMPAEEKMPMKEMSCGGSAKGYAKGGAVKPKMGKEMAPSMGMAGGMAQKPAPTMQPRAMKKPMMGAAPGGMGMKQGGAVGKMPNLNPKAAVHTTPKKMNVKSRLSAGSTATEMKKGGLAHADAAMDKTMIKKAIKMHDDQLHGGKDTRLTSLRKGGLAKCCY